MLGFVVRDTEETGSSLLLSVRKALNWPWRGLCASLPFQTWAGPAATLTGSLHCMSTKLLSNYACFEYMNISSFGGQGGGKLRLGVVAGLLEQRKLEGRLL